MSGEEKVTKKSWILDVLKSSFESGDFSIFFNHLDEGGFCQDDLDGLYLKLGEYVPKSLDYLPQQEDNVSNVLQSLTGLIQSHGLTDINLAAHLAKTVLLVITEEACSILNIKRAIHVFNLLIQNPEVLYAVMDDASIEGSLQILGRRVPATGDYECQALMFEAMYRVTSNENREYWANIWFSDTVARNMFMNLNPQKFESNCRRLLNYINRNEPNKRVFSLIASSVSFGSYQLSEPCGSEFWVDFNYDSQSISFYSSEVNFNECADNSEMWETILISDTSVKSYTVIERKSENSNEIVLLLNSPCHTLITSSNISNPAFNSYKISIVVWNILDIHEQLEIVYGKDKYMHRELTSPDVTETEKEMSIEKYMHRELTSADVTEAEKEMPIALSNDVPSLRKVSNLSAPIPVDALKNEDIIPGTDQNLDVAVYWKISQTIETIPISSEILSEDIQSQNLKKISASSEVIQIETSEVYEGVCKKRKSSMSVDTISCDLNVEGTNNNNQEREKETSTSSKETNNSENTSKGNNRRVRLYNLESAPVYDVPPLVSTNDPITQEPTSCKPISNIYQENNTSNLEQGANSSELKDRQKNESVTRKAYTTQKRRSTSLEGTVKKTVKDKKIKLFTDPSESDDDFIKIGKRNSNKRGGGKCLMTSAATNKQNSKRKRKLDEYNSDDSGSIMEKPAKRPRTAAVRARRKTKEILDPSFAIACDKIEVMNESYVERQSTSMQNKSKASSKKSSKNNTDTETQSSEVSWMKKKKSFEPPKRTYAHWSARKRSLLEESKRLGQARADIDKSLDVQIISESKSPSLKEPPCKKKKKVTAVHSESSDLENYDFVIEKKHTQRYRVLDALASDFQSISTNFPSINSVKKKLQSYSDTCVYDIDSNFNDDSKKQSEAAAEIVANDEHITNDLTKISHVTNGKHSSSSNFEKSSGVQRNNNQDCNHSNISNDNLRVDDIVDNQNCSNVDEQITPVIDKIIQEEKDEERENISSKHSLEDIEATSEALDEMEKKKLAKYLQEIKGKHFILQRFLKSVNEYSGTQSDSIITSESRSEINLSSSQDKKSLHDAEHIENSEFSGEDNSLSTLHPPSEKEVPKNQNNKMKNKASETSECEAKVKKPKILSSAEKLGKKDNSAIENQSSERVNLQHSRVYAKSINDPTTPRKVTSQTFLGKAMSEKIVPISKEYDGSEKPFKTHKNFKQLKRFSDHSFSSLHSKLTSPSVAFSEKNKTWFDTITLVLFQDANNLSRRLLATVQKCFFEFINKMNILRDNIISTTNEIEMPSSQNVSNNELKDLVNNCKIIRLEVEKSLRRMHEVGKQYFEAEERHFKKVKRKHMKASRKFISKMRDAQQNSIKMLEGKVLLKTKFHLKKILKHIMSV